MGNRAEDRLLSGADAAKLLNISESSFWRLVNSGKIPKVDLSGTGKAGRGRKLWQFRESTLWGYVDACTRIERPQADVRDSGIPTGGRADSLHAAMIAAGWDGETVIPRRSPRGR